VFLKIRYQLFRLSSIQTTTLTIWSLLMVSLPIADWSRGWSALMGAITVGVSITAGLVLILLWEVWGTAPALCAAGSILILSWAAEVIGSRTGVPFGSYNYTDALGPQILYVPFQIPLGWLMMLPPSWAVAQAISGRMNARWKYPAFVSLSALAMTAWDLFLDPMMVAWEMWGWEHSGGYFGIPWSNYLGWLLVSALITILVRPGKLPVVPLLIVYTAIWLLKSVGLGIFWGYPGAAIIGSIIMGCVTVLGWRSVLSLEKDTFMEKSVPIISPIRISSNRRYFVNQDGSPTFWLGDTQWEFFRLFDEDIGLRILRDRQAKGFNIILIMLTGVKNMGEDQELYASYTNLAGERPWIDDDPLTPNEKYFQHVDKMIRLSDQTGQTFVVGIYHQWHEKLITLDNARSWARWVAHRYREVPNLIWSMYPKAQKEFVSICRELAAGLQEGDGGTHLISVHPDPSVASSSFIHEEPWLSFNMIQTCMDYDQIQTTVRSDYQRLPVKPVVMAEGAYEGMEFGRIQTPHHIRKQAYWTQLAGGHHVYGHNDSWRSPQAWHQWLDSDGSRHLGVFKEIITSLEGWWTMVPDQSMLVTGRGSGYNLNMAARSGQGRWALIYLSEPSSIGVKLDGVLHAKQVFASWIDPRDGSYSPVRHVSVESVNPFTSPQGWEDALLLLKDGI